MITIPGFLNEVCRVNFHFVCDRFDTWLMGFYRFLRIWVELIFGPIYTCYLVYLFGIIYICYFGGL